MRARLPSRFFKDERGNVAIIAALCIIPLALAAGMAIDLSNATRVRLALQDATDSAALAIARNAATITDNGVRAAATNYIDASYDKRPTYTITTATLDRSTLTVTVNATANVPTTFAGVLGKTFLPVTARSVVKGQGFDYEIALVTDNSGSMGEKAGSGQTKIAELKTASTALLDAMLTTANAGRVKIGVVPFASSVKVGSAYATAAWMDTNAGAYYHSENFVTTKKRLDLFKPSTGGMSNVSWAGCVESRPVKVGNTVVNYDVLDTVSSSSVPNTLFVPWFAPDEPDNADGWYSAYYNNYLDDTDGNCSNAQVKDANNQERRQELLCKYSNETPDTKNGKGPNYGCTTSAITPLTSSRATLNTAITNMVDEGSTNVSEGLMWGWRILSPTAPFTEGAAYNTPNLTKVIILLTDGKNSVNGLTNQNGSIYSSYGYTKDGRLTNSNSSSQITTKMDERLSLACANTKAAGIVIYTVALGADADADLLRACASKPSFAYAPQNGSELTPVFQAIAASINKLRIAQ